MDRDLIANETPDVTAEACAWIAQLETGELTAADLDAFREWMRRSPRHAVEIKRLAAISKDLNVLTEMTEPLGKAAAHYKPIVQQDHPQPMFTARRIVALAVAASVIFSVIFFLPQTGITPDEPMLITTSIGDYQEVELSDGTIVKLNTDSQIEVAYDNKKRKVRLLEGEAFFEVVHDSAWPFYVYAGENYVRVVGTAFVVRLLENDFAVTVMKGRVEVAETTMLADDTKWGLSSQKKENPIDTRIAHLQPITLEAGQSIVISAMQEVNPIVTLSERDLQRALSWQEGLHDFSSTPLEEVVREMSRYSPLEIEIADQALRNLEFGGIFRTGETQPLFDALQASFGIDVEYVGDNKVRLTLASQE